MKSKKPKSLAGSGFTVVDALEHPRLLGSSFRPTESWHSWAVFLRALEGLAIPAPEDLELFRRSTGRTAPPTAPMAEAWIAVGRRSGKSRIASLLAVHAAAFTNWKTRTAPGEAAVIAVLAADKPQARQIFNYAKGLVESSPLLRGHVVEARNDILTFDTGAVLEVMTSNHKSIRGRSFALVLADEVAFWEASAESANPDREVIRAARPGLATLGGRLIALSSPYGQFGVLWDQRRRYWGRTESSTLFWQASSRDMHPGLPESLVTQALEEDPEGSRAEWLGEFRGDLSNLFTPEALDRCTAKRRTELPPSSTARYMGAIDAAGGGGTNSSRDGYAACCVHVQGGRVVVDWVELVQPPYNPLEVTARLCLRFRAYQVRKVFADQWSLDTITSEARRHGVLIERSEQSTSESFLEFAACLNGGLVELVDHAGLRHQLEALQRSTRSGGRERVEHRRGEHDDLAAAVARACVTAAAGLRRSPLRPVVVTEKPTVEVVTPHSLAGHAIRRQEF